MACIQNLGNGKYRIIVEDGYKMDGKRNRKTKVVEAKSKSEVARTAKKLKKELEEQSNFDGEMRFKKYVQMWKEIGMSEWVEKTRVSNILYLDKVIVEALGRYKLKDITKARIKLFRKSLTEDGARLDGKKGGYSPKTIQNIMRILHKVMKDAVCEYKIIKENPCDGNCTLKSDGRDEKEIKMFNVEQAKKFIELLEDEDIKYQVFFKLAINTGARRSEIIALTWKDIDFNRRIISFRKTVHYSKDKGIYVQNFLKNKSKLKRVAIALDMVELLKRYKETQFSKAEYDKEQCLLFVSRKGGQLLKANNKYRVFNK